MSSVLQKNLIIGLVAPFRTVLLKLIPDFYDFAKDRQNYGV